MMNVEENDFEKDGDGVSESKGGDLAGEDIQVGTLPEHRSLRSKGPDVTMLQQDALRVRSIEDAWLGGDDAGEERVGEKSFVRLAVGVGCLLVVLLLVGGYLLIKSGSAAREVVNQDSAKVEVAGDDLSYDVMLQRINEAVSGYFTAETIEQKLKYVRRPDQVRPLMEEYYKHTEMKPQPFKGVVNQFPLTLEYRAFWEVISESGKDEVTLPGLLVEQTDNGRFLVDWEYQVVYQPSDWKKFVESRSTESAQFRVEVEQTGGQHAFYGFEFSDYKKYRAYQVRQLGREDSLWAYAVRGSVADVMMQSHIRNESRAQQNARVILTLRYPENAMSDGCVYLQSLDSLSWIITETLPMSGEDSSN